MIPENLPEQELIEQAKDALALFIKFSDLWLEKTSYRFDHLQERKFKNRMWNANFVSKQLLARLDGKVTPKWVVGQKYSTSNLVEE